MRLKLLGAIGGAGLIFVSAVRAGELPAIPADARMGVAATSLAYATICDLRYKRPRMVRDAKALFLKFAEKEFGDPARATDRAFAKVQSSVTRKQAAAANDHTVEKCDTVARMLKRELAR